MWSKTKQALESRLAEGLKGRVKFNYAVYRMDGKCPTECQVLSILVDGESWFHTNQRFWIEKYKTRPEPEDNDIIRETGLVENYWGGVMKHVHQYLNVLSIEEAIAHENYFIRLLAVLDARLGKRKVKELADNVANEPEWFRKWIMLRAGAAASESPRESPPKGEETMSNNENQEQPAFVKTPFVPMSKSMNRRPWKIVSGGQTGVDRAALAAAMSFSIATGGWMPCGRLAEDGVVPEPFASLLRECPTGGFRERTRVNVVDSDATLILVDALPLVGGTAYTADYAAKNGRPCKVVLLSDADAVTRIRDWMLSLEDSVRPGQPGGIVLNVAGPRESGSPGIFARAKKTLLEAFAFFRNHSGGDLSAIDEEGNLVAWMDAEFAEELFGER